MMSYESAILILFVIASVVSVVARKIDLPYTIALMAVGIVLGAMHILNAPHLTQELLYDIFLPPLIFEAAIHLKKDDISRDIFPITTLVVPGVILSTLATAAVMIPISHYISNLHALNWSVGILFGAAVAATDPVAVVAIFKKLGVPQRLRVLVESESLLNDGTAIVIFTIAWAFIHGDLATFQDTVIDFFRVVGLGLLIGFIVGFMTALAMQNLDDVMIVITLTTVAAYGSFLIAEHLNVSGVMSTVAAGLVVGQKGFGNTLFPSIRLTTESFWEYIAFAMNSLIFLLMGLAINLNMLLELWPFILIAYFAMVIARFVVVFGTWSIFYPTHLKFPFNWTIVLGWGGLRGALSMVLALSLPDSFIYKELIVTLVFGVVLLSLFIQGLTMAPLLRLLKVVSPVSKIKSYEELKTQITLLHNTMDEIDELRKKHMISAESAQALEDEFQKEIDEVLEELQKAKPDKDILLKEEKIRTKRRLLMDQKSNLFELYRDGTIDYSTYETIKNEIDNKIFQLENEGA